MTTKSSGFVSGTLIHSINGLIPIEKVQVGDFVLSNTLNNQDAPSYKSVVSISEFDKQVVCYVSYGLNGIQNEKEGESVGICFVVVTENHQFWVEQSESWEISDPIYQQQWVRANQLRSGMILLLADGRTVEVFMVQKIVRTNIPNMGWLQVSDLPLGSRIDLSGDSPTAYPRNGRGSVTDTDKLFDNDGVEWEDYEAHVWLRQKVYNFEVESQSTYFVDQLGLMVK